MGFDSVLKVCCRGALQRKLMWTYTILKILVSNALFNTPFPVNHGLHESFVVRVLQSIIPYLPAIQVAQSRHPPSGLDSDRPRDASRARQSFEMR